MQKITYADKTALNTNASVPDTNKCNASDLNEIKNVINSNADETSAFIQQATDDITGLELDKQDSIKSGTSLPTTVVNGQIFLLYN